MKLHKGDNVKIVAGKDRGKTGKIFNVDLTTGRITIEGLNMFKKHKRPTKQGEKGQIVSIARSMNGSNVMLICPSCKKTTRVGNRMIGDKKVRICAKCKANLS